MFAVLACTRLFIESLSDLAVLSQVSQFKLPPDAGDMRVDKMESVRKWLESQ